MAKRLTIAAEGYPPESRHGLALADYQQLAALRLDERAGFRRRGRFGSYREDPQSAFMEKRL